MNNVTTNCKYELPRFWRSLLSLGAIRRDLKEMRQTFNEEGGFKNKNESEVEK